MDEGCHDRVAPAFFPSVFAGRRWEGDQLFDVFRVGDHGEEGAGGEGDLGVFEERAENGAEAVFELENGFVEFGGVAREEFADGVGGAGVDETFHVDGGELAVEDVAVAESGGVGGVTGFGDAGRGAGFPVEGSSDLAVGVGGEVPVTGVAVDGDYDAGEGTVEAVDGVDDGLLRGEGEGSG